MPETKWVAINMKAPENRLEREDLLLNMHADVVFGFRDKVKSWHFLWEGEPFKHTLLMRFYGDAEIIEMLEDTMVNLLDRQGIEWKPDEKYEGEADTYGTKAWEYLMKVLHLGSEFAIAIIENERRAIKTGEFKWSLSGYLERWVHLFMDQLSTQLREDITLFQLSIHRTAVNKLGEKEYRIIAQDLDREIRPLFDHFHDKTLVPLISELTK